MMFTTHKCFCIVTDSIMKGILEMRNIWNWQYRLNSICRKICETNDTRYVYLSKNIELHKIMVCIIHRNKSQYTEYGISFYLGNFLWERRFTFTQVVFTRVTFTLVITYNFLLQQCTKKRDIPIHVCKVWNMAINKYNVVIYYWFNSSF